MIGKRFVRAAALLSIVSTTRTSAAGDEDAPRAGIELTTGKTLRDSYAEGALVQPHVFVFGASAEVGAVIMHEQRGYGGRVFLAEDPSPTKWAFGAEVHFITGNLRFASGPSWTRSDLGGAVAWRAPHAEDAALGYQVGFKYARELIVDPAQPRRPPDGHFGATFVTVSFDRSSDLGLVTRGAHASLTVSPGFFVTPEGSRARHAVESSLSGDLPITQSTMVSARVVANVSNRGNANHSWLLGSINGVRGLDDNLYRNWYQVLGGIELRQEVRLSSSWQMEAALFSDAAAFEGLSPSGARGQAHGAVDVGAGLRFRAKALSSLLFRLDGSRLLAPYEDWFVQFGLGPHF